MSPFILILRGLALFLQTLFAALPLNISFSPHNTESWCLKCPTPFNPLPGQNVAAHCARGPGAGQGAASAQRSAGWREARLSLAAGAEKNTGAWPGPWLPPPPHAEGWRLVRSVGRRGPPQHNWLLQHSRHTGTRVSAVSRSPRTLHHHPHICEEFSPTGRHTASL